MLMAGTKSSTGSPRACGVLAVTAPRDRADTRVAALRRCRFQCENVAMVMHEYDAREVTRVGACPLLEPVPVRFRCAARRARGMPGARSCGPHCPAARLTCRTTS